MNQGGGETGNAGEADGNGPEGIETGQMPDGPEADAGAAREEEQDTLSEPVKMKIESSAVTLPEYNAENVVTVEVLEKTEETVTLEGIRWQSEPVYDGNAEGTYLFTAILPEDCVPEEGVGLPQITVTVFENSMEPLVQALIDRIAVLPELDAYLAAEPEIEAEEDYEIWMTALYEYAEESLAIWEEYHLLTEEQRMRIPEEAAAKLRAWAAFAEPFLQNGVALAAGIHYHGATEFEEWSSSNSLPDQGSKALMSDVDLGSSPFEQTQSNGFQFLCLNGHTIQGTAQGGVIRVKGNLQIWDCQGNGKVYGLDIHNPILVDNGSLWLSGGTIEAEQRSAIVIGDGSSANDGSVTGNGGTVSGQNGILVGSSSGNPSIWINGVAVNGKDCGIDAKSGTITLTSGSVSGGTYAVRATDNATVKVKGNVPLSATTASIYTVNPVEASGTGVSGLASIYTIQYEGVKNGDTVVKGSTDTVHYKLVDPTNTYVLVAEGGNLVARPVVSSVTVTAYKDGAVWTDGAPVYKLSSDNGQTFITDLSAVPPGTYTIYEGDTSTGTTVTAADGKDVSARLDYYTVTFYDGSTALTAPAPQIVRKGAKAAAPASLSKTGYTFRWVTADKGTTAFNFDSTIQAKTNVYAGWTPVPYSITYTLSGGSLPSGKTNPTNYTVETAAFTLNNPERTGYAFGGWSGTGLTGSANRTVTVAKGSTGNRSYTANWTANSYKVTLNGNGGSGTGLTSYTYGTGANLPTDWTRAGYTFGGWYAKSDFSGTAVTKILGNETGAKTFYAKWTAKQYTVTFDHQGATSGAGTMNKKVTYDNAYGTLPAPQKTGYTLKGWYMQADGKGNLVTKETTVKTAEDHTLYAYWKDETPPAAPVLSNGTVLPGSWTNALTIPLTLQDGVGVTELWVKVDNGAYQKVDGFSGGTEYEFTGVQEGNHTYYFKAKDAAGNESPESAGMTGMLDTTKPVIGSLTYENKGGEGFSWIFGKKDLVIHVPVTENGSGTAQISYTMTPTGADGNPDAGSVQTKTADVKGGEAKITFSSDFQGTIAIACTDAVGNAADGVTIGASGGGVIVEDTAPVISVMADRGIADTAAGQPGSTALSEEYYENAPTLSVTVTDDEKNQIVAGIASVTCQINGAEKAVVIDQSALQSKTGFTISNTEIPSGITTVSITAKDNAGNEASAVYTVKVKGPEGLPAASVDHLSERLKNLVPLAEYSINGISFTADAEGCIPIQEAWFGTTVSIVKKGNGSMTTDGPAQALAILARPQTPAPGAGDETGPNSGDGKLKNLNADTVYQISRDNGVTWQTVTSDGNGELTGCAPGEYVVRVGATEGSFASRKSGTVKIAAYQIKIQFMVNGAEYTTLSVDYGGNMTGIPAVPPRQNAGGRTYFGEWCDAQGKPAVFTNLTADMTVYAVYTPAYTVTLQGGTGYTLMAISSTSPVKEGGSFSFRVLLGVGYRRTNGFAVRVNGTPVTAAADGIYTIQGIIQDMTVTVEGVEQIPAAVDKPGNADSSGNRTEDGSSGNGSSNGSSSGGGSSDGSSSDSGSSGGNGASNGSGTSTGTGASNGSGMSTGAGSTAGGGTSTGTGSTAGGGTATGTGSANGSGTSAGSNSTGGSFPKTSAGSAQGSTKSSGVEDEGKKAGGNTLDGKAADGKTADGKTVDDKTTGSTDGGTQEASQMLESGSVQVLAASVENGRIVLQDGPVSAGSAAGKAAGNAAGNAAGSAAGNAAGNAAGSAAGNAAGNTTGNATGNVAGMAGAKTILELGKGTVIVTVVCEEQEYAAGVSDTVSVVNSVLTPEQIQDADDGENIEIRIAVETIPKVTEEDEKAIADCIDAYQKEIPELMVGMYVDISIFMKSGTGDWNAITATEEPIEVVIGIPERLQSDGRAYYMIRIHDGAYTVMSDQDDVPETITIRTDKFSCYAIAYRETMYGEAAVAKGVQQCRLCHKCPTFLGSCYIIWIVVIALEVIIIILLLYMNWTNREKKRKHKNNMKLKMKKG